MSWPLEEGWRCEVCGYEPTFGTGLTWGLINGHCRCDQCHVEYSMKDNGEPVTTPVCLLKQEYCEAAKQIWDEHKLSIHQVTEDMWREYGVVQTEPD